MKKIFLICICSVAVAMLQSQELSSVPDSISLFFQQQLDAFPQEKIHVQTDKSSYLSGERIWFRAHLVNAFSHRPIFISRYVYVEVINPVDDLVKRVKVRPDSTGAYYGYVDLDDELAEGAYTLRAYTNYMRNMGEDAFFRKKIHVLDPFSLQIEPRVSFEVEKNNINLAIQFVDRQNNEIVIPDVVTGKFSTKAVNTLNPKADYTYYWNFKLSEKDSRVLLLSLIYKGRKYNRYYTIPYDQSDYNVSFFPEGGYLIPGEICQVGFKSLGEGGLGEDISGTLHNSDGHEIASFESLHLGMGFFNFIPQDGESYYAICKNEYGVTKRFELPLPEPKAHTISARNVGSRIMITKKKGNKANEETFSLLIHHKGQVLYHSEWKSGVQLYTFPPTDFPEGVLSIILLNNKQEIVSERLLYNATQNALCTAQVSTSQPVYKRREHVSVKLNLVDRNSQSAFGNIAVSITDKESVVQDTTLNIVSTLLLSSELKGYIESPASYFKNGKTDKFALDALMMTQGWRRYNIPDVIRGKIQVPDKFEPELAHKITGKADGILGSLKEGQISLLASLDSLVNTNVTEADDKGRFVFNVEYPEGTSIHIQSLSKRGGKFNVINIDKESFPEILGAGIPIRTEKLNLYDPLYDSYLEKANEDYTLKYGIRTIMLEEITVTAQSKQKYKESSFYSPISATSVYTAEEIEKTGASSFRSLLYRMPGIIVRSGDRVTTTRSNLPVLFVIDNMNFDNFSDRLDDIEVSDIESIFVVRDNFSMPGYYPNTSGAVVITTKIGGYKGKIRTPPNIDRIIPLGYQQAIEFYAPAYETPEKKETSIPDLRTTIFWKPNVVFSEKGEAIIEFYSADMPTTYQVIGEGVSDDGKIIRFEKDITISTSF